MSSGRRYRSRCAHGFRREACHRGIEGFGTLHLVHDFAGILDDRARKGLRFSFRQPVKKQSPLANLFDKWAGDESDELIKRAGAKGFQASLDPIASRGDSWRWIPAIRRIVTLAATRSSRRQWSRGREIFIGSRFSRQPVCVRRFPDRSHQVKPGRRPSKARLRAVWLSPNDGTRAPMRWSISTYRLDTGVPIVNAKCCPPRRVLRAFPTSRLG